MKSQLWRTGAAAAIGCAAVMLAAAHTSAIAQARSSSAAEKVTVTGWVRSADSKPVGTSGKLARSRPTPGSS